MSSVHRRPVSFLVPLVCLLALAGAAAVPAADSPLAPRLAQALSVPQVAPGIDCGPRARPAHRRDRVRREPGHAARPGLDREAGRDLLAARFARSSVPHRHGGAGRRHIGRVDMARKSRAQGLRRPNADGRGACTARGAGPRRRNHARHRLGRRRRELLRLGAHGAGLEGVVLRRRVAAAVSSFGRPGHVSRRHGHRSPPWPPRGGSSARRFAAPAWPWPACPAPASRPHPVRRSRRWPRRRSRASSR